MQTKVKICGVTRVEDALLAERLGASYIGLVFASESPRLVTTEQAKEITAQLTTAKAVGVFVEQDQVQIENIANEVSLWGAQHYNAYEKPFENITFIHAQRVQNETIFVPANTGYILLDAFSKEAQGGTGHSFDWSLIPQNRDHIFLAGGINPNNVAEALAQNTYAIDLSSGVESTPGIKDPDKMGRLFENIKEAQK